MTILLRKQPIRVYWWQKPESRHGNFGDELTKYILPTIFKRSAEWSPPTECELVGTGSILEHIDVNPQGKPLIWGSGFLEKADTTLDAHRYSVLAVRGKHTLKRIRNKPPEPIILGDPGLLANELLPKKTYQKKYKIGVIAHFHDKDSVFLKKISSYQGVVIIDALGDTIHTLEKIAQCEVLLSSSLHGLVVADSLNIPNLHVHIGNKLEGGRYKFEDYYSAFNNHTFRSIKAEKIKTKNDLENIAKSIRESYAPPANLENIRKSLKEILRKNLPR